MNTNLPLPRTLSVGEVGAVLVEAVRRRAHVVPAVHAQLISIKNEKLP